MNSCLFSEILLVTLLGVTTLHAADLRHEIYDLSKMNDGHGPHFVRRLNYNKFANPCVMPDGEILVYYSAAKPNTVVIKSTDGGETWSEPHVVFNDLEAWTYPVRVSVDREGNLHMLILKPGTLDVLHTVSADRGKTWSKRNVIVKGRIGAVFPFYHCRSGRLVFAFHRRKPKRGMGQNAVTCAYSDDNGKTWKQSANWFHTPVGRDAYWSFGAVEPKIIQLKDGRLWMLIRTQDGKQYEAWSSDEGATWTKCRPSVFHSSCAPAELLRLPDGRMVLSWCNNAQPSFKQFGRIYANRDALHMAISDDDGVTWRGFREVYLSPRRNGGINDQIGGDFGTAYPFMNVTKQGKIIMHTGQGEGTHYNAMFLIDPKWLCETERKEDFSKDMRNLCAYTFYGAVKVRRRSRFLGPKIIEHPDDKNQKVMLLSHPDEKYAPNAAVWNFPLARKGKVTLELRKNKGAAPLELLLTDHYSHPNDNLAPNNAMFRLDVAKVLQLKEGVWSQVTIDWDLDANTCSASTGNEKHNVKLQKKTETGISYLRLNLMADKQDTAGWLVNRMHAKAIEPMSFARKHGE